MHHEKECNMYEVYIYIYTRDKIELNLVVYVYIHVHTYSKVTFDSSFSNIFYVY